MNDNGTFKNVQDDTAYEQQLLDNSVELTFVFWSGMIFFASALMILIFARMLESALRFENNHEKEDLL